MILLLRCWYHVKSKVTRVQPKNKREEQTDSKPVTDNGIPLKQDNAGLDPTASLPQGAVHPGPLLPIPLPPPVTTAENIPALGSSTFQSTPCPTPPRNTANITPPKLPTAKSLF